MALNKKDFVVVNGKRYYADGGQIDPPDNNPEQDYPGLYGKEVFYDNNGESIFNKSYYNIRPDEKRIEEYNPGKSQAHGHNLVKQLSGEIGTGIDKDQSQRSEFIRGENLIADWYDRMIKNGDPAFLNDLKKSGVDIKKFKDDISENKYGNPFDRKGADLDSENHNKIIGLFSKYNPNIFEGDGASNGIYTGQQVINAIRGLTKREGLYSKHVQSERNIIDNALSEIGLNVVGGHYARNEMPDGNAYYTVFTSDGNTRDLLVTKDGRVFGVQYGGGEIKDVVIDQNGTKKTGRSGEISGWSSVNDGHVNHVQKRNSVWMPVGVHGNSSGGFYSRKVNAQGGHLNRYYADGGAMGQIPLGEQPEDYNMVGEGGMHEENPMGGVPYGINQDGTQNMVEEGEVSVGDNVFSNRTQLSPELCQQLGLPEGTTPAEAMQQIEQLYEQGQLSEEEFQEVQQIIFQDQEQQKQNDPSSYQQGQVGGQGVPMPQNEGIDPSMMQGAPMDQQQMDPSMMQNEGIDPSMVESQPMAYGGYRW